MQRNVDRTLKAYLDKEDQVLSGQTMAINRFSRQLIACCEHDTFLSIAQCVSNVEVGTRADILLIDFVCKKAVF
jgi:hypothetical protein